MGKKIPIVIPWFAIYFIAVSGFNSLHLLPDAVVGTINEIDTFLLTMAMVALGMESAGFKKFQEVGLAPFYLSFGMLLVVGGYLITKFVATAL